ncbi:MAG: cytochrome c [Flavobacteriaceae bacterium]
MRRLALAGTLLLLGFAPALADEIPPAAASGRAIAQKWCGQCHAESGARPPKSDAPVFADVVRRPGRDADYLAKFLKEDHFPMTTYRLFDHERADVLEYLLWLQRADGRSAAYSGRRVR